jgi:anthranilate phosphoribosyltransferase
LPVAVRTVLTRIAVGDGLSSIALADAFEAGVNLRPPVRDIVIGSLMTAVMTRGPLVDDVVELLRSAMRVDARPPSQKISGGELPVIVMAGSGKKGLRTLNVSTPAALVAAAAGAKVIKVGSAATSSALGSRDLVRALGLPERRTAEDVRADLAACGFAFVAVEPEIPALDRLYGGRFHAPNPFSFGLAPLASPVRGDLVVFGLSHPRVDVAAHVLRRFDMTEVDVLSTRLPSGHYMDEIGPAGELHRCRVRNGEVRPVQAEAAQNWTATATSFELPMPGGPEEAIERTGDLLAGGGLESYRAVVSINAAHLLVLSGLVASQSDGIAMAEDILRSGEVLSTVAGACAVNRSA